MNLQDKLPERDRLVAGLPDFRYIEVEQRPGSGMRRHLNQPARSSGSLRPPRQACTSNMSGRRVANAGWSGDDAAGAARASGRSRHPAAGRRRAI